MTVLEISHRTISCNSPTLVIAEIGVNHDGSVERPSTGDAVLAGGRAVGRLGTVVEHVDLGPVALALLKRGLPAETELVTGPEGSVAAVVDADSLPSTDQIGAGRRAVERLRGGAVRDNRR